MSKYLYNDKLRRCLYVKKENLMFLVKILFLNQKLSKYFRKYLILFFLQQNKLIFRSEIKNRCILSGNSRSVFRRFRISRIFLRTLINAGTIPGVRKVSW